MCRRVGSASIRNSSSVVSRTACDHEIGELVQHLMAIGASFVGLKSLRPVLADPGEPVVNELNPGPGSRRLECDHQPSRMLPASVLLEPRQDEATLGHEVEDDAADPGVLIGPEQPVGAADPQVDLEVGAKPQPQCFLARHPPPHLARRCLDLDRADHRGHRTSYAFLLSKLYYSVMYWRCPLVEGCDAEALTAVLRALRIRVRQADQRSDLLRSWVRSSPAGGDVGSNPTPATRKNPGHRPTRGCTTGLQTAVRYDGLCCERRRVRWSGARALKRRTGGGHGRGEVSRRACPCQRLHCRGRRRA